MIIWASLQKWDVLKCESAGTLPPKKQQNADNSEQTVASFSITKCVKAHKGKKKKKKDAGGDVLRQGFTRVRSVT